MGWTPDRSVRIRVLACVSQKTRKLREPENNPVKLPKTLSRVSQSAREFRARENHVIFPRKFSGNFFFYKMAAAVGAIFPTHAKRTYQERTVLAGMRRKDVIERYRLSPERIAWLVQKFQDKLSRNTSRNFPLSAETQVSCSCFHPVI